MNPSTFGAAPHSSLRSYVLEIKYEFLRLLRTPSFALPTLLFPAFFYVLFGILLNRANADAARYMLATYGVFGIVGVGMFSFGITVAMERGRGFITYKRALPMPPGAYLLAKMVMAMIFASLVSLLLAALAATLGKVSLAASQWCLLWLVNVVGVLPFCAMGLYIGTRSGEQGAPAVVNLLYLPMSLLSGLWLPLSMLPAVFRTIAPVWPPFHSAQIALKVIGMDAGGSLTLHVLTLLGVTTVFFLLAHRRLRKLG
ncbi:MAG: ABC transporter permease [Dokdonella sp.]